MHYYQFNIGDYASHTRHLDLMEDLAYRRLLDSYYLHERPFSGDSAFVAKQIGMRQHVEVVESVLNEFFQTSPIGWINARADKEIEHYHSKIEQASKAGKASAERRSVMRSTGVQPTNNQEPITNNQEPFNLTPTGFVKTDKSVTDRVACPADELLELFHVKCPELPRVMMLNNTRRKHLVSRWREVDSKDKLTNKQDGLEIFGAFFERVQKSNFLCGRAQSKNGRVWKANFDWLILPTNFLKVVEGHYDNGR
jgi:uncharacterized protein YdaU (DUF1376 family)